ncbi:MAG: tetratricopeptide repeat protein [Prevotellaceae bacterium]|jgi:hypothetical protein|nr:tetratricopeptide repeat protein [Prevotellaceae bacterium]
MNASRRVGKRIGTIVFSTLLAINITAQEATFDTQVVKTTADSAYVRGDYVEAITNYKELLQHGESADIYYNLGNSYYKSDSLGAAILNYERALLLRPTDEDIQANLEIARAKTIDKVTEMPDIFFIAWIKALIRTASSDTWSKWGIACFVLLIASLYVFLFVKQPIAKKAGFIGSIVCLIFVVLTNLFAASQKDTLTDRTHAIIMKPSVTVRSTPDVSGTELFILHEGRKVGIKDDSMASWKEIALEDGKVGWVSATDLERI